MNFKERHEYRKKALKYKAENGDISSLAEILQAFVSNAKSSEFQNNQEALGFVVNACNKILNGESPNNAFCWNGKHKRIDQEWIVDIYLFSKGWAESKIAELDGKLAKETRAGKSNITKEKCNLFFGDPNPNPETYAIQNAAIVSGLSEDRVEKIIKTQQMRWKHIQEYINSISEN